MVKILKTLLILASALAAQVRAAPDTETQCDLSSPKPNSDDCHALIVDLQSREYTVLQSLGCLVLQYKTCGTNICNMSDGVRYVNGPTLANGILNGVYSYCILAGHYGWFTDDKNVKAEFYQV